MTAVVTTTRPIDFEQLGAELGHAPITATTRDDETTIEACDDTITQEQLQAAVDAHTPKPPPPSEDARLQQQIDELTDIVLSM